MVISESQVDDEDELKAITIDSRCRKTMKLAGFMWTGSPQEMEMELPTDEELIALQEKDPLLVAVKEYLRGEVKEVPKMRKQQLKRYYLEDSGLLVRAAVQKYGLAVRKHLEECSFRAELADQLAVQP